MRVAFRLDNRQYTLTSPSQLAELLMDPSWPNRGPAYFKALGILIDYFDGREEVSVQDLCEAFSAAVDEADLHSAAHANVECDPMH